MNILSNTLLNTRLHTPFRSTDDTHPPDDDDRLLSDAEAERVVDRVNSWCGKDGDLRVVVNSAWSGGQRWARNRAFLTSNVKGVWVTINRKQGSHGLSGVLLNQVDDESLRAACTYVE